MRVRNQEQIRAFNFGRQLGVKSANEMTDQLSDLLLKAREELAAVREECFLALRSQKQSFDAETDSLRVELRAAIDALNDLRAALFNAHARRENEKLN